MEGPGGQVTRDPRSAGGGGWQFLQIYNHPKMGIEYIRRIKEVVDPFIVPGGSREMRDAILLGHNFRSASAAGLNS